MIRKIAALALALILLCACASAQTGTIAVSFYPIYIFAENVLDGIEGISLVSLTPPGTGCLHDYQLLTGDMKTLAQADALVINGAGMEDSFLPAIRRQMPELPVADLSEGIELIEENGESNSHIWLSPKNAMKMVENLCAFLCALYPEYADQMQQNTQAYLDRLRLLDAELEEGLSHLAHRDIVTFHEAFPYFAKAYQLNCVASLTQDADEAPSPRELARVIDLISEIHPCPLFAEPGVSSDALQTVAAETGEQVYVLDPVTEGEYAKTDYEDKMRINLQVLQQALGSED